MFSRARDTDHAATPKEAEFDFNLGYGVTVVTAMFFVILGAYTMYGSGDGMLAGSGVSFAQKLIKLYTAAMGGWAAWVIVPAAFSAMFSTTLTLSLIHISEPTRPLYISYAVFCLKKKI